MGRWNVNNVEFHVAKRGLEEAKRKSAKKHRAKAECPAIAMVPVGWSLEHLEGQ